MKGLMEILAKSGAGGSEQSPVDSEDPATDSADSGSNEGFEASAASVMEALKSGDPEAFSEALKACIEMAR